MVLGKTQSKIKQILHLVPITLMVMPNITSYASVNSMNALLSSYFDKNINADSYTATAVPAVFSCLITPYLIDCFGS